MARVPDHVAGFEPDLERSCPGAVQLVVAMASLSLLMACATTESDDWRMAELENTRPAYQQFLEQHSNSSHATEARLRLTQLQQQWSDSSKSVTAHGEAALERHNLPPEEARWNEVE